jgi:hypothetical protein
VLVPFIQNIMPKNAFKFTPNYVHFLEDWASTKERRARLQPSHKNILTIVSAYGENAACLGTWWLARNRTATNNVTHFSITSESNLNLIQGSPKLIPIFITPYDNIWWLLGPLQQCHSLYWKRQWGGGIWHSLPISGCFQIVSKSYLRLAKSYTNLHHTLWQHLMTFGSIPMWFFVLDETVRVLKLSLLARFSRIQIES